MDNIAHYLPFFDFLDRFMKTQKEPDFFSTQVAQARRFYLEGPKTKDSPLTVVCGGCEHTRPDFEINRADFPFYSIEFIAKGAGRVLLNHHPYDLKPGTIFSYGPGISQRITSVPENPMVKYFIDFTGSAVKQMLKKHIAPLGTAICVNRPDEIARIFDELIRHGLTDSPYKSKICATLMDYLIYRIAEMAAGDEANPGKAFLTYQECRRHIKDRFIDLHSLHEIAGACAIDSAYLCRLFKRFDTQSPYQYLLNLKMVHAADRFQKSGAPVKEIAFELGFDDPFHFTRVFKKIFGISPQSFKKLR